jgi:hypothetical protein
MANQHMSYTPIKNSRIVLAKLEANSSPQRLDPGKKLRAFTNPVNLAKTK